LDGDTLLLGYIYPVKTIKYGKFPSASESFYAPIPVEVRRFGDFLSKNDNVDILIDTNRTFTDLGVTAGEGVSQRMRRGAQGSPDTFA
jgi:hypothetical protein